MFQPRVQPRNELEGEEDLPLSDPPLQLERLRGAKGGVSVQNIARNGTEWHGIREFHGSVPFRAIPCLHFFYFFDFFIKMGSPMNFKGTYRSKKCIGVLTALYG